MAGFLFGVDNQQSLIAAMENGVFSTRLRHPKNGAWSISQEGTFAEYSSMKEGDNVYFFIKRKIYGIATLENIIGDCKFLNYPNSNLPTVQEFEPIQDLMLLDLGRMSVNHRFICVFKPSPHFFRNGIDMDEVLASSPNSFRILRTFWKLSSIKFSDEENQALKNILLRKNIETIENPDFANTFQTNYNEYHDRIRRKIENNQYALSLAPFVNTISEHDGRLKHEMAIETAIIYQLTSNHPSTVGVFGSWDYLSHQVIASPFKPIDYVDKMDIFGYRYINNQKPTISHYLIIEIKKGVVERQDLLQLMKYVDWVKSEYSFGDYSMIKAFMVGFGFEADVFANFSDIVERKYIAGVRPSLSATWADVKLVKYVFNREDDLIDFVINQV